MGAREWVLPMTDQWITRRDFGIAVIEFCCGCDVRVPRRSASPFLTALCHRLNLAPAFEQNDHANEIEPSAILVVVVVQFKIGHRIDRGWVAFVPQIPWVRLSMNSRCLAQL